MASDLFPPKPEDLTRLLVSRGAAVSANAPLPKGMNVAVVVGPGSASTWRPP